MSTLPTYAPRYTNFSWGDITFSGLAEDFLTITPSTDITDTQVGADGSRSPTENPDYTCTVTVTLKQTSPTNRKLAQMLREQRRRKGQLFSYNFTVDDPSGSLMTFLKNAYIQAAPEQGYGMTSGDRVWVFNADLNYDELSSGIKFDGAIEDNIASEISAALALFG